MIGDRRAWLALPLFFLPGDQGLTAADARRWPGSDRALLAVGGVDVPDRQVLESLWFHEPEIVRRLIDQVAGEELVLQAAEALGVEIDAAEVQRTVAEEWEGLREGLEVAYGAAVDVEEWVLMTCGLSPDAYRERLAAWVLQRRLTAVVVRDASRRLDALRVRAIVVGSLEEAQSVVDKVRAGADFRVLARKRSLDPSGAEEGLLPRVTPAWGAQAPHVLAAEGVAAGEVGGPVHFSVPEGDRWVVVRVLERIPADDRPYAEAAGDIAADLTERPVGPEEWAGWFEGQRAERGVVLRPGFGGKGD